MHGNIYSWRDFYLQEAKSPPGDKTGKALRYELKKCINGKKEPASFQDFIENALYEGSFSDMLTNALINVDMMGYVWECPSVSESSKASTPFEFVVIPALTLARRTPNPKDFIAHMPTRNSVVSFPNLSGDAVLVVPTLPLLHDYTHMGHLASFLRHASRATSRLLWRVVAETLQKRLQKAGRATKVWLSTSGLSVPWLHIRLDAKPKYYQYTPYKDATNGVLCSSRDVLTTNCNVLFVPDEQRSSKLRCRSVGRIRHAEPDTISTCPPDKAKSTTHAQSPYHETLQNKQTRRYFSAGRMKQTTQQVTPKNTPPNPTCLRDFRNLPLRMRAEAINDFVTRHRDETIMTREEESNCTRTDFRRKKSML